jgi:uncharacterized delta-60 repeat protein
VQPDGGIVAGGAETWDATTDALFLVRLRADGRLDPGFGKGGVVATESYHRYPYYSPSVVAIAILPDGRIAVVITQDAGAHDVLVRYRADGSLDTSFGAGGRVPLPFAVVGNTAAQDGALAVQPDGAILLSGRDRRGKGILARFLPDGSLDSGFGTGGVLTTPVLATGVAVQPDGAILVAGTAWWCSRSESLVLARYTPAGAADAKFGVGGVATAMLAGGVQVVPGIVLQPDGRILVGGEARFDADGSLDPTFSGGTVPSPVLFFTSASGLEPDGKIVVAGAAGTYGPGIPGRLPAVGRYLPNGALDPGFSSRGHRQQAGDPEIEAIAPATGQTTDLSANPARDVAPVASPDGKQIAFISWRAGEPDLYVMQADGSDVRRLTDSPFDSVRVADFPYLADRTTIAWSPDSRRIAFDAELVTPLSASCSTLPSWATYVVDADGTNLHRLAADARSPSWSPDGTRIAFVRHGDGTGSGAVVVADAAGRHAVGVGARPLWSPAGGLIAFSVEAARRAIAVVHPDGSGRRVLARVTYVDRLFWSPDGRELAFTDDRGIELVPVGGGRVRLVSRYGGMEPQLAWSPDGSRIAIGGNAIELIDPTGGRRARTLAIAPRGASFASIGWSSAGTILAAFAPSPTAP